MIEIEFEPPGQSTCDCCGGTTTRLTRFVYRDGNAFAVYYALFTDGHERKVAYALIGLGEWGVGSSPEKRTAFSVKIWQNDAGWAVTVTDRSESPWKNETFLGTILDREPALQHPFIKDVYHLTDHMVVEDQPLIEFFK
ncbi:conserved hypothetical protein [Nitrospina gracilis 3/211]|uniref:Uncharacterized protein n=1 Tax=Nitrospina gracilis (strain 3/211) TaxID=1266370 RepID=M1Z0T2_NITG3|nr:MULTISPECIES: hypothetical protein [Nitrospina]MCF8723999.1 hypothetical protein [Nitrospina sp. Nb-3]CCQ91124.1 conserved hypothetical protein [Nitrospina gracilis 3/211]